jgi:hypothetical protein
MAPHTSLPLLLILLLARFKRPRKIRQMMSASGLLTSKRYTARRSDSPLWKPGFSPYPIRHQQRMVHGYFVLHAVCSACSFIVNDNIILFFWVNSNLFWKNLPQHINVLKLFVYV